MRNDIHPTVQPIKATCSCGHVVHTLSTIGQDISIEVCSHCHPFYTGQQKLVDSAGRVERFKNKYSQY